MKRFYFHIRIGDELVLDDEGRDLPDFPAAQTEARQSARELLAEAVKNDKLKALESIVIADEDGETLDTVALASFQPRFLGN